MNSDVGRSATIQPVLPAPGIRETLEKRVSEAESDVNQNNNQNNNNNNNNQDNNENTEDPNGPGGNQEIRNQFLALDQQLFSSMVVK